MSRRIDLSAIARAATRPVTASKTNFHSVDLLRGLAAITVLVFHYRTFIKGGGSLNRPISALDNSHLLQLLRPLRENGQYAVMFFWMISGFVFMNVYAGTRPAGRAFWVNRFARLYPLHLLTLLTVAALQIIATHTLGHQLVTRGNDAWHFVQHLFMANAWITAKGETFNGPIWSVSVEVLIYAAFYLYVRFCRVDTITLVAVFLGFMAVALVLPQWQVAICGIFFFGGALTYLAWTMWPGGKRHWLLVAACFAFVACAVAEIALGKQLHMSMTLRLLPVFGSLILLAAASEHVALRGAFRRTQIVGDITYSTYLWHTPLQMIVLLGAGLGLFRLEIVFTDAFFVAYMATVCGFAWLSFRMIERPAQHWIRSRLSGARRDKPLIGAP